MYVGSDDKKDNAKSGYKEKRHIIFFADFKLNPIIIRTERCMGIFFIKYVFTFSM